MLTSSTQLQNKSFHVVGRTRTSVKCRKTKNAHAKRAKLLFFRCQICKFVTFLLPSSSWLLKLPNNQQWQSHFLLMSIHYHSFTFLLPGTMTCPAGLVKGKEHVLLPSLVPTASFATLQIWCISLESELQITLCSKFSKQSYIVSRAQMTQISV